MIEKQSGHHVWPGRELTAQTADWTTTLTSEEVDELLTATAAVRACGLAVEDIRRTDFPVPHLQGRFKAIADQVEHGRGFVLVRGLPVESLSDDDCKLLFWGIGTQMGLPVCQSKRANYIAEVKDIGEQMGQATTRAYRAGGPLRFHTDQCDILALLCIREAISGGESRVVSSAAIHNAMLERRPDLLKLLYEPLYFSRQGEEVGDELPWYERPVFDSEQGRFTSTFSRSYIESAQKMDAVPRLRAEQNEALDMVARLADELSVTIALRKGDMQLFNNHVVYHSRTDYKDHAEEALRRTQLRLWLSTPNSRPLPRGAETFFGDSTPGALRGGVTPPSGKRFSFNDWRAGGWTGADLEIFRSPHVA